MMIRTLRASRSLPSLRPTAISHASHPVPVLPTEYCLNSARSITTTAAAAPGTPKRTRKNTSVLTEPITPLMEPKKRGRPRKNTIAPTVHKRSNSTDAKPAAPRKSKKGDQVPTIPQPAETHEAKGEHSTQGKKSLKDESNVPLAADKFRDQQPVPEATSHKSEVSASNPADLGTRVQVVGAEATKGAQEFAQKAVDALDSAKGVSVKGVKDLLQSTLTQAKSEDGNKSGEKTKDEHKENGKEIPASEKNALLAALGLTGLWVVFGGRFQKKSGGKKYSKLH